MKLSLTELYRLRHLIEEDIRVGRYYGVKKHYFNRSNKLLSLIKYEINQIRQKDIVI